MLTHLLARLARCCSVDGIVLGTSTDPTDDPIAQFAERQGVECYRGFLEDVASRMLGAARSTGADVLVRVSGDSPLLDPVLVDQAVGIFRACTPDLVTNVARRTFPKGQSVEVLSCTALTRAIADMSTASEREHVTPRFYSHPEEYAIRSFEAETPRPAVQLSIDEAADLARCELILQALGEGAEGAGWEDCVRAYDAVCQGAQA